MCKGISSFLGFSIGQDTHLCQPLNYLFFLTIVIRFQHAGPCYVYSPPDRLPRPSSTHCDEDGRAIYSL